MLDGAATGSAPVAMSTGTLPRLTSLRAFAALVVFLSHLDIRGGTLGAAGPFVAYGYVGVGFFFVLSGFVLTWSYVPGAPVGAFYLRRFARIWPNHFVMLVRSSPRACHDRRCAGRTAAADRRAAADLGAGKLRSLLAQRRVLVPVVRSGVLPRPAAPAPAAAAPRRTDPVGPCRRLVGRGGRSSPQPSSCACPAPRTPSYTFPPLRFGEFLLGVAAALELRRGRRVTDRWARGPRRRRARSVAGLARDRFPAP